MKWKISVKASPGVIYVPTDFLTIQEAINNASSGDTIFVHNGTYYENLVVNKSVSLVGEYRDFTIIEGNRTGNVINITVNDVDIMGLTIKESGTNLYDSGIHVEHSSGNIISQNTITDNANGISFYSSSNNVVSDNIILNNYYSGISLSYSSSNVVSGNTILNNYYSGISFYSSSNNVVSDNTLQNNYDGISLSSSSNNVVSGNAILNNYDGISFYPFSSNNVVSGNTLLNNSNGMYIDSFSSNNTIYHNNFNNTNQVSSVATNDWNYGGEGNYWGDYRGQDLNGDGIGDYPYIMDENNKDNSPLMGMFHDFAVSLKREIYHVTLISNSTVSNFRFEIGEETGNEIILFNVIGEDDSVGFCRIAIPIELIKYPYIVMVGGEEVVPKLLDILNATQVCLYFTYLHENNTVTIISSEMLLLYNELLDKFLKLQIDLVDLNTTYYDLVKNYSVLLDNYSQLQDDYRDLNSSYQEHLSVYSENVQNLRNLVYIFAATTAIFLITTIYLSKRAHAIIATKTTVIEDKK